MIRKPPASWDRPDEDRAVRAIRTVSTAASTGVGAVRRSGQVVIGLICYFIAAIWGFAAIASGLGGSLPSLIGIGAMAALIFWFGRRALAIARGT